MRKGISEIIRDHIRRMEMGWLWRHLRKFLLIRRSVKRGTGRVLCGPVIAHFFCTERCNSTCRMCGISSKSAYRDLDTGKCLDIIDELADLGTSGMAFTGGEPLLRSDIFVLLGHAHKRGMDTVLATNGLELAEHAGELVETGVAIINVSIDGSRPEIHERIRSVSGGFAKTLEGIKRAREEILRRHANTRIVVSTVISEENIDDLGEIISLARSVHADRIIFCPVHAESGDGNFGAMPLGAGHDVQAILYGHRDRGMVDNSSRYLASLDRVLQGGTPPLGCCAGYTVIMIDHMGRIFRPCECYSASRRFFPGVPGEKGYIRRIWFSEEMNAFRRDSRNCSRCYLTVNREFDPLFDR